MQGKRNQLRRRIILCLTYWTRGRGEEEKRKIDEDGISSIEALYWRKSLPTNSSSLESHPQYGRKKIGLEEVPH